MASLSIGLHYLYQVLYVLFTLLRVAFYCTGIIAFVKYMKEKMMRSNEEERPFLAAPLCIFYISRFLFIFNNSIFDNKTINDFIA